MMNQVEEGCDEITINQAKEIASKLVSSFFAEGISQYKDNQNIAKKTKD